MEKLSYQKLDIPNRFMNKLIKDMKYLLSYKDIEIERIVLFGSIARGDCMITSDIDIMVVTKTQVDRYVRGDIASFLEEELDGVTTDVVFYQEEVFKNSESLFAKQIKKDGIIIYERDE